MPQRTDGRNNQQLRPISITRGFTKTPAGSVLWKQGETIILATASISHDLPPFFRPDRAGGWITAEYVMLPGSTPQRKQWPKIGHTDSRGTEIQRIIGRAIRAAVDLSRIGPHTIALDCQVLQADGGTRTASICAAYVALVDAIRKLPATLTPPPGAIKPGEPTPARWDPSLYQPKQAIVDELSAVSVGIIDGEVRLDLAYEDDSVAEVDLNLAATASGKLVEIQGSAENGQGFDRQKLDAMIDLGMQGIQRLLQLQRAALAGG